MFFVTPSDFSNYMIFILLNSNHAMYSNTMLVFNAKLHKLGQIKIKKKPSNLNQNNQNSTFHSSVKFNEFFMNI